MYVKMVKDYWENRTLCCEKCYERQFYPEIFPLQEKSSEEREECDEVRSRDVTAAGNQWGTRAVPGRQLYKRLHPAEPPQFSPGRHRDHYSRLLPLT